MPVINKQTPAHRPQAPPANGGILASVVPVSSLHDDYLKFVLYGKNRVGKTTLACQFPKPLLLVSFEPGNTGGARSVKTVDGVSFIRIDNKQKAVELARELRSDRHFKTHVLDTITSLQDVILKEIMNLEDAPVQLNWGSVTNDEYRERSEKAKEIIRLYRDLPAHTVFVAQEKDHNPPKENRNKLTRGMQSESFFAANAGGATVDWLHDACDYIVRLYLAPQTVWKEYTIMGKKERREEPTGKTVRRLLLTLQDNYAAGFRSCTPDRVPEFIEEPTWEKIKAAIDGREPIKRPAH